MVNTPEDIFHDAYVFLFLQFCTIPFTIAYNLLSGQIRALGNSKQPFYFLLASSFLNIFLDIVFILLLGMGVEGAGIATFLSQVFASSLCWWFIKRHMTILVPIGDERQFDNKKNKYFAEQWYTYGATILNYLYWYYYAAKCK